MNATKKHMKDLDDLLLCNDIIEIKIKAEKLKKEFQSSESEELWVSPYGNWLFQLSVILILLFSLAKLTLIKNNWFDSGKLSDREITYDITDISIYFFWLLMPPIFFLLEYLFLFGKNKSNRLNPLQINDLKYCQELGAKIWTAVVVCFSILLYVRYGFKF